MLPLDEVGDEAEVLCDRLVLGLQPHAGHLLQEILKRGTNLNSVTSYKWQPVTLSLTENWRMRWIVW